RLQASRSLHRILQGEWLSYKHFEKWSGRQKLAATIRRSIWRCSFISAKAAPSRNAVAQGSFTRYSGRSTGSYGLAERRPRPDGDWIRKSSSFFPDLSCAVSHRGCFPRPAQVSPGWAGFLYFGNTWG